MFSWLNELLTIRLNYLERINQLKNETKKSEIEVTKEDEICESCRTLKMQLAIANDEKKLLLDKLINPSIPVEPTVMHQEMKPIGRTVTVWSDRKKQLEANSRLEAEILKKKQSTDELEKQITNAK